MARAGGRRADAARAQIRGRQVRPGPAGQCHQHASQPPRARAPAPSTGPAPVPGGRTIAIAATARCPGTRSGSDRAGGSVAASVMPAQTRSPAHPGPQATRPSSSAAAAGPAHDTASPARIKCARATPDFGTAAEHILIQPGGASQSVEYLPDDHTQPVDGQGETRRDPAAARAASSQAWAGASARPGTAPPGSCSGHPAWPGEWCCIPRSRHPPTAWLGVPPGSRVPASTRQLGPAAHPARSAGPCMCLRMATPAWSWASSRPRGRASTAHAQRHPAVPARRARRDPSGNMVCQNDHPSRSPRDHGTGAPAEAVPGGDGGHGCGQPDPEHGWGRSQAGPPRHRAATAASTSSTSPQPRPAHGLARRTRVAVPAPHGQWRALATPAAISRSPGPPATVRNPSGHAWRLWTRPCPPAARIRSQAPRCPQLTP